MERADQRADQRAVYKVLNLAAGALAFGGALTSSVSEAANPNCTVQVNLIGQQGSGRTIIAESPTGERWGQVSLIDGRGSFSVTRPSNSSRGGIDTLVIAFRNGVYSRAVEVGCGNSTNLPVGESSSVPTPVPTEKPQPAPKTVPTAVPTTVASVVEAKKPTSEQELAYPLWLWLAGGAGLLAVGGGLAYWLRNRRPNQPNNPNTQGVFVPVQFNVAPVVIGFTPNLQNPNNPNQAPVAPGAPTQALPTVATAPIRPARQFRPAVRRQTPGRKP